MKIERLNDGFTGMAALDLANIHIRTTGVQDPQEQQDVRNIFLMAGQTLADMAAPGRWGKLAVAEHFRRIAFMPAREREHTALVLMWLFGWLFFNGYLDAETCQEQMKALEQAAPMSEILTGFCRHSMVIIRDLLRENTAAAS